MEQYSFLPGEIRCRRYSPLARASVSSLRGTILTERVENYSSFYAPDQEVIVGSFDAGQGTGTPGWTLRNFLMLLNLQFHVIHVKVVLFKFPRGDDLSNNPPRILTLKLVDCM
jgi:hypothetical protein